MKGRLLLTVFLMVMFSSCTHYYYVPNVQNVPLFKEKNEYRFSGNLGGGYESTCIEIQGAYSISDKIGVMSNFMSAWGESNSTNSYRNNSANGNYLEGAVGYYKPIGKIGVFELYGGFGGSGQHHEYGSYYISGYSTSNSNYGWSDLTYIKFFAQPSIGITFNLFDIALSSRLSSLNFVSVENHVHGNTSLSDVLIALPNSKHLFIEPAITFRFGWKSVKLQLQYSGAKYLNRPTVEIAEEYHLSTGLVVSIGDRFSKKISKTDNLEQK